jgi:hypothetical protein
MRAGRAGSKKGGITMVDELALRLRIEDEDDLSAAHDSASSVGIQIREAQAPPGPGLEPEIAPIVGVLIGAGALAGAKFILDWWEKRRGGLVIDLRPSATDNIFRDRDVPWGYVVLFPADGGEVKVETKDAPKDTVERWISEVISGTFKSATDLAKAAANALGKDRVDPPPAEAEPARA